MIAPNLKTIPYIFNERRHHLKTLTETLNRPAIPIDTRINEWEKRVPGITKYRYSNPNLIPIGFNELGMRGPSIDSREAIVCLGCSQTEGIGLREDHTWPQLLQARYDKNKLEYQVLNAGFSGRTVDSFRHVLYWLMQQDIKIKTVLLMAPGYTRISAYQRDKDFDDYHTIIHDKTHDATRFSLKLWKTMLMVPANMMSNYLTEIAFMKTLCDARGIKFLWSHWDKSVNDKELVTYNKKEVAVGFNDIIHHSDLGYGLAESHVSCRTVEYYNIDLQPPFSDLAFAQDCCHFSPNWNYHVARLFWSALNS